MGRSEYNMTYCARCGGLGYGEHCDPCEERYREELRQAYEAGQPEARSAGHGLVIWVHHDSRYCGCRGYGLHYTDYDTEHPCPYGTHDVKVDRA